jgi:hypothetical protein
LTTSEARAEAPAMRASAFVTCMLALCACKMPDLPGELVGKYAITGTLEENTCGQALPVDMVLRYQAELRVDTLRAYWVVGPPPAHEGRKLGGDTYEFTLQQTYPVRQDQTEPVDPVLAEMDPLALYGYDPLGEPAEPDEEPCTLIIHESLRATVFEGDNAPSDGGLSLDEEIEGGLVGKNEIAMRAAAGSHCNRVLASAGGPFEQLPCAAHYALEGELLDEE